MPLTKNASSWVSCKLVCLVDRHISRQLGSPSCSHRYRRGLPCTPPSESRLDDEPSNGRKRRRNRLSVPICLGRCANSHPWHGSRTRRAELYNPGHIWHPRSSHEFRTASFCRCRNSAATIKNLIMVIDVDVTDGLGEDVGRTWVVDFSVECAVNRVLNHRSLTRWPSNQAKKRQKRIGNVKPPFS